MQGAGEREDMQLDDNASGGVLEADGGGQG